MRVIHVTTPSTKKVQPKRKFAPSQERRNGRRPVTDPSDERFFTSAVDMRNRLLFANVVAIPEESDADLEISLYSVVGRSRTSAARSRTPALDLLRTSVAADSHRSLKSVSRLSAHLCPDVPMRYCPEIAFAERSVQKPFTKWPPIPTAPGDISRPFARNLQRRPRSQYAGSERSWPDRSSIAGSAFCKHDRYSPKKCA
jgi:hypothetical protein